MLTKNIFPISVLYASVIMANQAIANNEVRLQTLTVDGNKLYSEQASEETDSYTTQGATTGSKAPASMRDIPQSISVITHQMIEDQNVDTLDELAVNTPGVRMLPNEQGRSSVIARGYKYSEYNVDGLPSQMESRLGTMPNLAAFDRVEIMRGPSGLFDASGEMGGIINLIRKRGTYDFQREATASIGSDSQYNLGLDIGGPLNESGTVRGRTVINTFGETPEETDQRDHHETFYGALDFDLSDDTTLGIGYLHQERHLTPNNGLPLDENGELFSLPHTTYYGAPWNSFEMESDDFYADIKTHFSNGGFGKLGLRYTENQADWNYLYAGTSVSSSNTIGLRPIAADIEQRAFVADASYSQPFAALGQISEIVVGVDYKNFEDDRDEFKTRIATQYNVSDLQNIAYYDILATAKANGTSGLSYTNVELKEAGAYGKLTLRPTADLALILGARASSWEITNQNKLADTSTDRSDNKMIWYGGAVYDLDTHHSLYASASQLYVPQEYVDAEGEILDPREGKQIEAGVKGSYYNNTLNARLSVYQIDDKNAFGLDSSYNYIASGKRRMKGAEVEISGQVTEKLKMIAGYSYIDTEIIEESSYDVLISYMPEHMVNIWGDYQVTDKLNIGLGLNTLSKVKNPYGEDGKAYEVVNTMVAYQFTDALQGQLNINNVFNEHYYERVGDAGQFNIPGDERSFKATVRYQF